MSEIGDFCIFKTAWYWRVFSIIDILLSAFLVLGSFAVDYQAWTARGVVVCIGGLAFLLGVFSWVYLTTYTITITNDWLITKVIGSREVRHDIKGIKNLRKRGLYMTLDYGTIPRTVILAMTLDNAALFQAISNRAFGAQHRRH